MLPPLSKHGPANPVRIARPDVLEREQVEAGDDASDAFVQLVAVERTSLRLAACSHAESLICLGPHALDDTQRT